MCRPYFPKEAVNSTTLTSSSSHTFCPWTGIADYFAVTTDQATIAKAAWTYRHTLPGAGKIKNHVSFWHGGIIETRPFTAPDNG